MSNLIVKIKHNADLIYQLNEAIFVANYAIKNKDKLSSANISDIGLPPAISNQILRKYVKNKKCKRINQDKIKLSEPSQFVKIDGNAISIVSVKEIKEKEIRKVKGINHKISKQVVDFVKQNNCGIKLESLKDIHNNKKNNKLFRYTLNPWSYYKLDNIIAYNALLQGISVQYIDSINTCQICSKCGDIEKRNDKIFKCVNCGHTDHVDINANFNIVKSNASICYINKSIGRNGCTDKPIRQCCGFVE